MIRLTLAVLLFALLYAPLASAQSEPVLRKGDVVSLSLPGEATLTADFQIDREGRIVLPEVGGIEIAGLTVGQALATVRDRLSVAFQDLDRLRLGLKERRLPITVLGQVTKPGRVELPEDATAQVAIDTAGGFTEDADRERLQLQRGERIIEFDFKRYLATGDAGLLPALQPLDTLFVPSRKASVRIVGAVAKPGSFPWSGEMSLVDALSLAGGSTPQADLRRVRILGQRSATGASVFDLDGFLKHGGDFDQLPQLQPGATVVVPTANPDTEWLQRPNDQSITVIGAVGSPGRYAFERGRSLLEVLAHVGGPTNQADLQKMYVVRSQPNGPEVSAVNLNLFFRTGDASLLPPVAPGDLLYVPTRDQPWLDEPKESTVRLLGAVKNPGRYAFDDSMTILDLLAQAGGVTSDAWQENIVAVNLSCCRDQARTFNLVQFAKTGDYTALPVVRPGDTVYVPYTSQSRWAIFIGGVRDAVQVVSLVTLVTLAFGG